MNSHRPPFVSEVCCSDFRVEHDSHSWSRSVRVWYICAMYLSVSAVIAGIVAICILPRLTVRWFISLLIYMITSLVECLFIHMMNRYEVRQ